MRKIMDKLVAEMQTGFLGTQLDNLRDPVMCPPDVAPLYDGRLRRQFVERQKLNAPGGIRDQAVAAGLLTEDESGRLATILERWNGQSSEAKHSAHRIINHLFHVRRYIKFKETVAVPTAVSAGTVTQGWFAGEQPARALPRGAWSLREGGPGWGRE